MINKKILLVEDDLDIQENLKLFLEMEGYSVMSAMNGQIALDILKSGEKPFLILLDLMMPIMNGYELLAVLKKLPQPEFNIPTILLSAATDLEETASKQVVQFIRKPISLKSLLQAISQIAPSS